MAHNVSGQVVRVILWGILILSLSSQAGLAADSVFHLDNGMEVILKENHSSPMITSMIFVKSGSKYESRHENGITHFLEHLLFNGTVNMSREQLDRSIRDLGGYLNAFTRKDLTAYLVLVPRQYIDYGLTVQADMLFNSVFPEEELAKERKVVIEEINQSADAPGAPVEEFYMQKAYAATNYLRPVLGYKAFIEQIPREAIIAYWKEHYTPDKMTILMIGDFESDQMKATIESIFGKFEPGPSEKKMTPSEIHQKLAEGKHKPGLLIGQNRYDTVANVTSTYINFSIEAPHFSDPDYLPMDLLSQYLALDEVSPLKRALQGGAEPLATEVGIYLETKAEFSRLEISAITDNADNRDTIVETVLSELALVSNHQADPTVIEGIKTSVRCDNIYYAEKLHFYGFIIAPLMMTTGWDFIQQYPDLLDSVTWSQCSETAGRWLAEPDYVVTVVQPLPDTSAVPYEPSSLTTEEVKKHFDMVVFDSVDLFTGHELTYPVTDTVSFHLDDRAVYSREVLENGLTVIVKSGSGSQVFAINILGKNRSANETPEQAGITDFVNRCLEKGTTTHNAGELARNMNSIGANLTLYDNPWIPYDDRYTTRRYSFIKFETIEPFAETGFGLLADIVMDPAFEESEIENVRRSMLGVLGRNAASPTKVARNLFYTSLFVDQPFAKPIMGTPATIASVSVDVLRAHHRRFYAPDNMILSVVTSRDTAEVMGWIKNSFGRMPAINTAATSPSKGDLIVPSGTVSTEIQSEQIGVYAGGYLPGASDPETIDLKVAASILSSRLYLNLREKHGLAYSTGAGTKFDHDFGWYYLVIGTASENRQRVLDGLSLQTEKLAFDGPTADEVKVAKNQMWGRLMSAKLSRVNQAYYLSVDEFLGRETAYDRILLEKLADVNVQSVRRAASKYFRPDTWVTAIAGPGE